VRNNPTHQYRLGADLLESSSTEKNLGVPVKNMLTMRQQRTLVAKDNRILGCIKKELGRQGEEGAPSPLLCPGEAISGVLTPVLGFSVQERTS